MKDKIINISKFYFKNFEAILYNICSLCFILINTIIPLYTNEIIYFNSMIIHNITINYKFDNEKKRKNFNMFMKNLIDKNNDFINNIRQITNDNENINNYYLDDDNIYSSDSYSDSDNSLEKNNIVESSSSDILTDKILNKTNSNNSINDNIFNKFDYEYKKNN
jgi:hypothetical protein|tara:strand:- start:787 stop:1278 length:492 start_codon:yes stop_codon:yes gene_type:complete